jgi:hypothetical protein
MGRRKIDAATLKLRGSLQGEVRVDNAFRSHEGERIRLIVDLDCSGDATEVRRNGVRTYTAFVTVAETTVRPSRSNGRDA